MADKESCYECSNNDICWLKSNLEAVLMQGTGRKMLNIDSDKRPLGFTDIYTAVGQSCLRFTPYEKKERRL